MSESQVPVVLINLIREMDGIVVHHRESINGDTRIEEELRCISDPGPGWPAFCRTAVPVMDFLRPVDGQPHQEPISFQKVRPGPVEVYAVGLEAVSYRLTIPIAFLELNRSLEKRKPHEGWLAPLPSQGHVRAGHGKELPDHLGEHLIGHAVLTCGEERAFMAIEAVRACQIAVRPCRLYQNAVEGHAIRLLPGNPSPRVLCNALLPSDHPFLHLPADLGIAGGEIVALLPVHFEVVEIGPVAEITLGDLSHQG